MKKITNALFCFLLISTIISCEQLDKNDKKNELGVPDRSINAEPGNLKASITPASGSTLTSGSVVFSWNHPGGYYYIDVGTTVGGTDILETKEYFQATSYTVNNLPASGKIYVRLFYYDYGTSKWLYNDYNYTMNIGGSTNVMTPASGATLTESSTLFSWTHSADYYRLYLGTAAGKDDYYDSGDLTTKSHTVKNIPQSGTVYLRLWLYINGSWAEKFDYSYTAQTNGGGGDKDFIITCVVDNLDPADMTYFANGLVGMGYSQTTKNTNVSSSQLNSYFKKTVKTLYHTGHGDVGYISTSDGGLSLSSVSSVAVENLIIATCLTLKDKGWKSRFVSTTENIMGYTNNSFDNIDNTVANNMITKMKSGKSYLQAWYEVNSVEAYLYDRWCSYSRSGSSIVEYSAVSGNNPKAATVGSFYSLANGKVLVSSAIGKKTKSTNFANTAVYSATKDQMASTTTQDVNTLVRCSLSQQDAIQRAQTWVSSRGTFEQIEFDRVISLSADNDVIGHQVRFKRVVNSLPVRGNAITDYVSLLVTDNDIVTTQYNWSSITPISLKSSIQVLSPGEAIEKAADAIASRYKGDKLKITKVVSCLGFKASNNTLVPAYEFLSADDLGIVIDAVSGIIL